MNHSNLMERFGFDSFLEGQYPKTRVGPVVEVEEAPNIFAAFQQAGLTVELVNRVNGTGQLRFNRPCSPADVRRAQAVLELS